MTEHMVRDGGAATRRSGGRGRGGPAVSRERRSGGLKLVSVLTNYPYFFIFFIFISLRLNKAK